MNVLICTGIFPPESGGPATYTAALSAALLRRGHAVRVITYGDQPLGREYPFPVVQIKRSVFKPLHYFRYFRAVRKYGAAVNVIYAQDPVSAGYPASLAARSLRKPLVLRVPGDYSWEQAYGRKLTSQLIDDFQKLRSFPGPIGRIRDMQIRTCKSAAAIIVPSEYLKRIVTGWGIKDSKSHVVYNAIMPLPEIDRDKARKELGFVENDFVVFSAGRDVPWKGFLLLEEVMKNLSSEDPSYKLVILKNEPRAKVLKYLRACDVFVLDSGYEGFAFILLEAGALGAPIIGSAVGANAEVIQDGKNGLIIEYNVGDLLVGAIRKIRQDPVLRERFRQEGRKLVQTFSEEKMINETERLLTQYARLDD